MDYFWTDCPRCGCQVSINYIRHPARITGSVRRWSSDRSVNDGRAFELPGDAAGPDGSIAVSCVCGQELRAVSQAQGERALADI